MRWVVWLCAIGVAGVACGRVQRDGQAPLLTSGAGGMPEGAGGEGGIEEGAAGASDAGISITGKLIDTYRQPAAGCQVQLGTTTVVTDARGEFRFEHVTPPYDIAFSVPSVPNTTLWSEYWLYTGLTRADPTLQFGRVLVNQFTPLSVEPTNVPIPPSDRDTAKVGLGMSFAGPGLELTTSDFAPLDEFGHFFLSAQWCGGMSISGTLHSLAWLSPSGDPHGLDLEFLSYQQRPFTLSDEPGLGPVTRVILDFSPSTVPVETYPVSILGEVNEMTALSSWLVFDTHAAIGLTAHADPRAMSLVPMPILPGAHPIFAATRTWPESGYGVVRRRADSAATVTTLTVPTPRTLTMPNDDAGAVTTTTRFEWSAGPRVSVLGIYCPKNELHVQVVTAANSASWPKTPLIANAFPSEDTCLWYVEERGTIATIDDSAGPSGLDACDDAQNCEHGPALDDSSWTFSATRTLVTAK